MRVPCCDSMVLRQSREQPTHRSTMLRQSGEQPTHRGMMLRAGSSMWPCSVGDLVTEGRRWLAPSLADTPT